MPDEESRDWILTQLDDFIEMTESRSLSRVTTRGAHLTNRRGSQAPRSDVLERVDIIERILDHHYPEWRERRDEWSSQHYEFEAIRQAAIRCRARLQTAAEVEHHLEGQGPTPTRRPIASVGMGRSESSVERRPSR